MTIELWNCTCGATGMKGKFCTKCGKKYETIQDELAIAKAERVSVETENGWTCPACGATGQKRKFCTKCGHKYVEPIGNMPVSKENINNAATEIDLQHTDSSSVEKIKPNCEEEQMLVLNEGKEAKVDEQFKNDDGTWTCSVCGATDRKGKFCTKCGYKLGETVVIENRVTESKPEVNNVNIVDEIDGTDRLPESGKADVLAPTENNKKKMIPIIALGVLVAFGGGWYFMNNKTDTKRAANTTKIETSKKTDGIMNKKISEEATLSGNENGVKTFASRLEAKNKEAKEKANSLIWVTTKMYKRGNDVIVEGAYYNGSGQTIDYETDMTMEISFYGKGKEVGHLKDVTFNKAPTKGLLSGKQKKVRYEVKGKANEVGEFSTFEVTTKVKKSN